MAAKRARANLEFLLVKAELKGLDVTDLPAEGEELTITVPLIRPLTNKPIGSLTLLLRA